MITLTDTAKTHIQNILQKKGENAIFRLSVKKTGCSGYMYVPEILRQKKEETDIEVSNLSFVMHVDAKSLPLFDGTEIDYVKKGLGVSQLEYHNPQADSLCGCGESFSVKTEKA